MGHAHGALKLALAPPAHQSEPHVADAVREALGTVVPDYARDLVVALALRDAHDSAIPTRGEPLRRFIVGPLHAALEGAVGAVAAEAATSDLERILAPCIAETSADSPPPISDVRPVVRPRAPSLIPTMPVADPLSCFGRETIPLRLQHSGVVLASRNQTLARLLVSVLGGEVRAHIAHDALTLLEILANEATHGAPVIVLDCTEPSIRASTLATLDLPPGAVVILWGPRAILDAELRETPANARTAQWTRCHSDGGLEGIAFLLRGLRGA